jgi:four helix bundle protein
MQDYRKLTVWKKSHLLTLSVYKATSNFPKSEVYGLTSQIRRSCASIPTNIAEGCGRDSGAELNQFLRIAQGSASELEYQLLLSVELMFLTPDEYDNLSNQLNEVRKMLTAFISKLCTKTSN